MGTGVKRGPLGVPAAVDVLLRRSGFATSARLATLTGLTRQAIAKQLRPMLDAGELERLGLSRAVRYVRGGLPPPHPVLPDEPRFWHLLGEDVPGLLYVRAAVGQGSCASARAAQRLAARFGSARFVILDFAGVTQATEAWLAALVGLSTDRLCELVPINLTPELRTKLERGLRHADRKEFLRADV